MQNEFDKLVHSTSIPLEIPMGMSRQALREKLIRRYPHKKSDFSTADMEKLRKLRVTYKDIAHIAGITKQAVYQRLNPTYISRRTKETETVCIDCGVAFSVSGKRGKPRERCESCRIKRMREVARLAQRRFHKTNHKVKRGILAERGETKFAFREFENLDLENF